MSKLLVTCAFTTYNASETIHRAVYSAINQTYKNLEILIVDDHSNDSTLEIINEIIATNLSINIKLIQNNKNEGVAISRNICINNANGEFICFFDDDDKSYKNRIEKQLDTLLVFEKMSKINSSKSTNALCYGDRIIHYDDGSNNFCKAISTHNVKKYSEQYTKALLSAGPFPSKGIPGSSATCTLFARKDIFFELNQFNPELRRCEDLDLAVKAVMKGIELISTNSIIVDQFHTNTLDKKNSFVYEFKLLYIHKDWLKKKNLYEFALLYLKLKNNLFHLNYLRIIKLGIVIFLKYPIHTSRKLISAFKTISFTLSHRLRI